MGVIRKLSEYVEVVRNGIKNADKIIEAITIAAQLKNKDHNITDEAVAEILRRKDICAGCPFNSKNMEAAGTYKNVIGFEHCTLCKCRIGGENTKEYCLDCNCGIMNWNEKHPDNKMELKWTAFEGKIYKNDNEEN